MAIGQQPTGGFRLQEATIAGIHEAFASGAISCRRLVEYYLDRIEAYDRNGPKINSIITVNPHALEDADRLDQVYQFRQPNRGPARDTGYPERPDRYPGDAHNVGLGGIQ